MKEQLKYVWRNWRNKPLYSLISFFGFTFGIAASLLIYIWVDNELSYEKFHPEYQRIYRVLTLSKQGDQIVKSAGNYRPVARTLKLDYPQIEFATYISNSSEDSPFQINDNSEKIEGRGCWSTEDFFQIFRGFEFLEGNRENAFANPSGIVLSKEFAKKLFGNQPALGKTLISDKYGRDEYTVTGVVEIPAQSHIGFDYMLSDTNPRYAYLSNNWGDFGHVLVYIKLVKGADIDETFLSGITNHISRYSNKTDKLLFQPIADIHLFSDYETSFYDKNVSSYKYVMIFSGLALLVLLMAALNFSVLSVARASERNIEIGIKKVNGASRSGIASQFMLESISQALISTVLALILVIIILPWFNHLSGQQFSFNWSAGFLFRVLLLALLTGIVSGIYPSLYLSALLPSGIFRGDNLTGSRSGFIKVLSTVQFTIAIFFLVATGIFVKQMNYINNKDLGLEKKDIVVIPTGLWYNSKAFKDELLENPNILSVSASTYAPADYGFETVLPYTYQGRTDSLYASMFFADEDFAETYKLEIVKGEYLQFSYENYWDRLQNRDGDQEEKYTVSIPVVINETAEKALGFENPIGERLGNNVIVGVVKDFHYHSLRQTIEPLVIQNNPENIMTMNIRIVPENRSQALAYITEVYKKYRDSRNLSYSYFEDIMDELYIQESRLRNLTTVFAVLAIIIAVMGIFGMSYFSCGMRTKEIGIRKVNGAKTSEMVALLNKDFVKWVGVAFVFASPFAFYAMNKWLQGFSYKTGLSWWIFVIAGLLALGIALLTVSWQSWKVAARNPVESLRYE